MTVRADDHAAAAGHLFTHVLMDDGDVGRYEDAAVFLGCRQAEDVVVFIDGAADGAERIMTVCQHVGKGEFFHSRCLSRLDDADKSNVMGSHGVELDFQVFHGTRRIMIF